MSARNRYRPWFAPDPLARYAAATADSFWNLARDSGRALTPEVPITWIDDGPNPVKVVTDPTSPSGLAWVWQTPCGLRAVIHDLKDPYE